MITPPHTAVLDDQKARATRRRLKICMHLANIVQEDARVMRDATALVQAGFEVTIVDIEKDRSRPAEEEIDGVRLKHIMLPAWFAPSRFKLWFLIKYVIMCFHGVIALLKTDADLYHAHVEKALPACYIVAHLRRKPLIFDAPDLTLSDPHLVRWRRLRALAIRLLTVLVSSCDAVITASPRYVSELQALYGAQDVTVVRNVPGYRTVTRSDHLRLHLGLGAEVRIVLYQGNISANRELDRLVRAAKFLGPNIVIVMMGWGEEAMLAQLESLIASNQVADRVRLLPAVPYSELLEWTASADLGLTIFSPDYSQSIRFTLPNKLFEYLMAGVPVLSAQLDAIADVLKRYDVGQIVPSLDPAELAAVMNALLADPASLARMQQNALAAARDEFHWEKESQKLVQLYDMVLGSKYPLYQEPDKQNAKDFYGKESDC